MRRASVVLAALIALAVGCGGEPCYRTRTIDFPTGPRLVCLAPLACGDVNRPSEAPTAPAIVDANLAGQLEQDPWTIILTMDFVDSDGNLSAGNVAFYLGRDGDSSSTQPLRTSFKQSAVPEDALEGRLAIPLRFNESLGREASVDLGLQLEDGGGLHSNCYGLTLQFEVK